MANNGPQTSVSISILDKEYLIGCDEDEQEALLASARYLDKTMRDIRDSGKVVGADRIAVMAALNIAHELLSQDGAKGGGGRMESYSKRLRRLQEKIEHALFNSQQLEI
ncbi:MAG TPA: cell division protein ZapA [Gammaproteobacteria bacterium]|nr:cell division protein ZapA [Gammaproteobacteria bacterium]